MIKKPNVLFLFADEGQEIDPCYALLGETFREAGYETFGTGKWHNGTDAYRRSFNNGGQIFFGGMDDHWNVPVHDYDPSGKHSTELFSEACIDFLNDRNEDNPFLAYVSYMAPHDPRTMP